MKHRKVPPDCSACDDCTYIGEGDFVCQRYIHIPNRAIVLEDWTPTNNHMQCRRKRKRNGKP